MPKRQCVRVKVDGEDECPYDTAYSSSVSTKLVSGKHVRTLVPRSPAHTKQVDNSEGASGYHHLSEHDEFLLRQEMAAFVRDIERGKLWTDVYSEMLRYDPTYTDHILPQKLDDIVKKYKLYLTSDGRHLLHLKFSSECRRTKDKLNYKHLLAYLHSMAMESKCTVGADVTLTMAGVVEHQDAKLLCLLSNQLVARGQLIIDLDTVTCALERMDRPRTGFLHRDKFTDLCREYQIPLTSSVLDQVLTRCQQTGSAQYSWRMFLDYLRHVKPLTTRLEVQPQLSPSPHVASDDYYSDYSMHTVMSTSSPASRTSLHSPLSPSLSLASAATAESAQEKQQQQQKNKDEEKEDEEEEEEGEGEDDKDHGDDDSRGEEIDVEQTGNNADSKDGSCNGGKKKMELEGDEMKSLLGLSNEMTGMSMTEAPAPASGLSKHLPQLSRSLHAADLRYTGAIDQRDLRRILSSYHSLHGLDIPDSLLEAAIPRCTDRRSGDVRIQAFLQMITQAVA